MLTKFYLLTIPLLVFFLRQSYSLPPYNLHTLGLFPSLRILSSSALTCRLFLFCVSQFSFSPDARFFFYFFFASSVIHHTNMIFLMSWFLLDRVTGCLPGKLDAVKHITGGGRKKASGPGLLPAKACLVAPRLLLSLDLEALSVGPLIAHPKHLPSRQDYVKIKSTD